MAIFKPILRVVFVTTLLMPTVQRLPCGLDKSARQENWTTQALQERLLTFTHAPFKPQILLPIPMEGPFQRALDWRHHQKKSSHEAFRKIVQWGDTIFFASGRTIREEIVPFFQKLGIEILFLNSIGMEIPFDTESILKPVSGRAYAVFTRILKDKKKILIISDRSMTLETLWVTKIDGRGEITIKQPGRKHHTGDNTNALPSHRELEHAFTDAFQIMTYGNGYNRANAVRLFERVLKWHSIQIFLADFNSPEKVVFPEMRKPALNSLTENEVERDKPLVAIQLHRDLILRTKESKQERTVREKRLVFSVLKALINILDWENSDITSKVIQEPAVLNHWLKVVVFKYGFQEMLDVLSSFGTYGNEIAEVLLDILTAHLPVHAMNLPGPEQGAFLEKKIHARGDVSSLSISLLDLLTVGWLTYLQVEFPWFLSPVDGATAKTGPDSLLLHSLLGDRTPFSPAVKRAA